MLFTGALYLVLSLINSITFVLCVQNLMAFGRWGRPHTAPIQEDPANFMDTMREMAHAMREQVAAAQQMMDQWGKWPEAGHGGNPHGPGNPHSPGVDLDYINLLSSGKRIRLVFEECMTSIRLMNGSRLWKRFFLSWISQTIKRRPLPPICSKLMRSFGGTAYEDYSKNLRRKSPRWFSKKISTRSTFLPQFEMLRNYNLCSSVRETGLYLSISPNLKNCVNFLQFTNETLTRPGSASNSKVDYEKILSRLWGQWRLETSPHWWISADL